MKTAIVWFKTDLRLADNETLLKAISKCEKIIPLYCFDEAHFKTTTYGLKKTGSYRAQFLLESLQDLDYNLRQLGSGLIVVQGKPEVEIPKIVEQFKVQKVFAKTEVAFEEKQTEQLVRKALFKLRCELETFSTSTLYHPDDLPFSFSFSFSITLSFSSNCTTNAHPHLFRLGLCSLLSCPTKLGRQYRGEYTDAL